MLCEKSMAVTLEECEAMGKDAQETGCYLANSQNQSLDKACIKAKKFCVCTMPKVFCTAGC